MAWAHVQTASNVEDSGATADTIAIAFASNNTAGNHIYVWGGCGGAATSISVADTLGNTYTQIEFLLDTSNQCMAHWYAQNILGGANTVTVTVPNKAYRRIQISERSGLATTGSLDVFTKQAQASPGTGTDGATSTAVTTTVANACVVGAYQDVGGTQTTITAGTNFTSRGTVAGLVGATEDRNLAVAGSVSATFTLSVNNRAITMMAAFKEAAGGATFIASKPKIIGQAVNRASFF